MEVGGPAAPAPEVATQATEQAAVATELGIGGAMSDAEVEQVAGDLAEFAVAMYARLSAYAIGMFAPERPIGVVTADAAQRAKKCLMWKTRTMVKEKGVTPEFLIALSLGRVTFDQIAEPPPPQTPAAN